MTGLQLFLQISAFTIATWLGLYLLARNPANPQLRWAGLGLVAYAISLAADLLAAAATTPTLTVMLIRCQWAMLFWPVFFWTGTVIYLLPETEPLKTSFIKGWQYGLLPLVTLLFLLTLGSNIIIAFNAAAPQAGFAYAIVTVGLVLPLIIALGLAGRAFYLAQPKKPLGVLLAATIFFALGVGLLIFPLNWLPRHWLLPAMTLDFIALGLVVAGLDAFDQGETFLPDLARSLDASLIFVLLFGGPVVLTMAANSGRTLPMLVLLLATITLAIASQVFSDPIQAALDSFAFAAFPRLQQARAELRTTATILPRVNDTLNLEQLDDEEFARLTRKALSNMGNLPRLAANPLTRLALIGTRLSQRGASDNTLERAAELKTLLSESIAQLKPQQDYEFGTSEAWRFYNALYYPYVVGLKPYSRRADYDGLDAATHAALDWFRTYVPERTLYNWQNAAAQLVAQDLRELSQALPYQEK